MTVSRLPPTDVLCLRRKKPGRQTAAWCGGGGQDRPIDTSKGPGLKPKDCILQGHTLAMALRADGWWLRSPICWVKGASFCPGWSGSVMPESVKDRPTQSYEMIFLMTKRPNYFYDQFAVREDNSPTSQVGVYRNAGQRANGSVVGHNQDLHAAGAIASNQGGRNLRSVWTINTEPSPLFHFATFPYAIPSYAIQLGSSERGVCPHCLAPHTRIVEKGAIVPAVHDPTNNRTYKITDRPGETNRDREGQVCMGLREKITKGWAQSCTCEPAPPIPATVLDCFLGSGTSGLAAKNLGRSFVGIELNPDYASMASQRLAQGALDL